VKHVDDKFLGQVTELYRQVIPPGVASRRDGMHISTAARAHTTGAPHPSLANTNRMLGASWNACATVMLAVWAGAAPLHFRKGQLWRAFRRVFQWEVLSHSCGAAGGRSAFLNTCTRCATTKPHLASSHRHHVHAVDKWLDLPGAWLNHLPCAAHVQAIS
jgi:hypothetical protein